MALILSNDDLTLYKSWMKNIFLAYGVKDGGDPEYLYWKSQYQTVKQACKNIIDTIVNLKFETDNYQPAATAIEYLSNSNGYYRVPGDGKTEYWLKPKQVAQFIAYFCFEHKIYWDDAVHTKYELDYFKKTELGAALWKADCFISQQNDLRAKQAKLDAKHDKMLATDNTTSTPKAPRAASSNNGPAKSGRTISLQNCAGLVSAQKEVPSAYKMLFIQGEWTSPKKTTPRIFVTPNNGVSPLKVNLGSGQGFDDCVLMFDDITKANAFLAQCLDLRTDVINLTLRKQTTDPNGYFRVNTQFGEAFIKAARLGE